MKSAYMTVFEALVARLTRTGVNVGGTAGYPRVEVHSIREGERGDKGGSLRTLSAVIESISTDSVEDVDTMNTKNLELLEEPLTLEGFTCLGIIPTQLNSLTEASESQQIIYRLLQSVDIYVEEA